jgi:hypothetical protein
MEEPSALASQIARLLLTVLKTSNRMRVPSGEKRILCGIAGAVMSLRAAEPSCSARYKSLAIQFAAGRECEPKKVCSSWHTKSALPVIVFLDGDNTGQPRSELDQVVDDLLETSGIVFGIKDEKAPKVFGLLIGEQAQISHYIRCLLVESAHLPIHAITGN